jgi:Lrp/AsnC family leucine-responsive transcriptional regulator
LEKFSGGTSERELLRALQANSKRSLRELAREVGLPISTVHEKIRRLEREGIIKKYCAVLDEKRLGFLVTGFILVSIVYSVENQTSQKRIAEKIAALPNVQEVHIISGDWDLIVKVKAKGVDELGSFITEKLRNIHGVGKTLTAVVFETVKEEATLDV